MKRDRFAKQKSSQLARVNKIVDEMTLFDDDLMSRVFDQNIPATELLLRTFLQRNDIRVVSVQGQKKLKNPLAGGRNIVLDIVAEDASGVQFDVEVQRRSTGADPRRVRFHSSMMDSRMLQSKQDFPELLDSYVIFITEKDFFKSRLPLYSVHRYIDETGQVFGDGSHILYVNGEYQEDDAIGALMKDFHCKDASEMQFKELAAGVQHFKEGEGRKTMCEAVEKYAEEQREEGKIEGRLEGRKQGARNMLKELVLKKIKKGKSLEQIAEELDVSIEDVTSVVGG